MVRKMACIPSIVFNISIIKRQREKSFSICKTMNGDNDKGDNGGDDALRNIKYS